MMPRGTAQICGSVEIRNDSYTVTIQLRDMLPCHVLGQWEDVVSVLSHGVFPYFSGCQA